MMRKMTSETWIMSGSFWRIPILVEWHDTIARVQIYPMPHLQRLKAEAQNLLSGIGRTDGDSWWVERPMVNRVAEPNRYEDLEMAIRWNPPEKIVYTKEGTTETINEFVADVCTGLQVSPDVVSMLFSRMCQTAMDWLYNKQRVVDLFFCRLHPMPFRENWQQQIKAKIAARQQKLGVTLDTSYDVGLDLIAYNTVNKIVTWSIAVEHRRPWYEMGIKLELEKRKLGADAYVRQTERSLEKAKPSVEAVLHTFMWQTSLPPVFVRSSEYEGHRRFVAGLSKTTERLQAIRANRPGLPKEFSKRYWRIVKDGSEYRLIRRKAEYIKKSDWWEVRKKRSPMPELPAVRQKVDDMRTTGQDLR